ITLSGNGKFKLSSPDSGSYAGVVIYQTRDNTRAISFSGNATDGIGGTIYAASAAASISGNASFDLSLIVDTLTLSGNAVLDDTQVEPAEPADSGAGSVSVPVSIQGSSPTGSAANAPASSLVAAKDAFFTTLGSS
ncbi:MAG: hypothetical protein ACREHD_20475, partial [Pirellulales bacterium]